MARKIRTTPEDQLKALKMIKSYEDDLALRLGHQPTFRISLPTEDYDHEPTTTAEAKALVAQIYANRIFQGH